MNQLDPIDRRILEILVTDARIPLTELARELADLARDLVAIQ